MTATYPAIYALLRERMADDHDQPTDDEIIAAALDVVRDAVERVGQQHPKWDLMSTHYEGCWKHHSECALTLALDVIDALRVSE